MKVLKRCGNLEDFNKQKIVEAILKAGNIGARLAEIIADSIEQNKIYDKISVEEIQDEVEKALMGIDKELAKKYIRYRYKRELIRENDTFRESILDIVSNKNEYVNGENSNKNPKVASTQRDYLAGEVSKDLSQKLLLSKEVVTADKEGILHFHDKDYFLQKIHNCCLVNLEDMLNNGTVISGTKIDKPSSFSTACNIATQIMAQVASNQYGLTK